MKHNGPLEREHNLTKEELNPTQAWWCSLLLRWKEKEVPGSRDRAQSLGQNMGHPDPTLRSLGPQKLCGAPPPGRGGAAVPSAGPSNGDSIAISGHRSGRQPVDSHCIYGADECGPGFYQKLPGIQGRAAQAQMLTDWVFLEILQLMTQHSRQKPETHFPSIPCNWDAGRWLGLPRRMSLREILVEKAVTRRGECRVKLTMAQVTAKTSGQGQLQHVRLVSTSAGPPRQPWDGIWVTLLTLSHPSLLTHPPRNFIRSTK